MHAVKFANREKWHWKYNNYGTRLFLFLFSGGETMDCYFDTACVMLWEETDITPLWDPRGPQMTSWLNYVESATLKYFSINVWGPGFISPL